jgi:hypothetical protein
MKGAPAARRLVPWCGLCCLLAGRAARAEDPTPALTVTVAAAPVLGIDQESEIRVDVAASVPPPRQAPRLHASTGHVEELVRAGPRSFIGRYVLPAERFPQAAILVAELDEGGPPVRGFAVVPLSAAASPAFHTDPGAEVTLRIGDSAFGPQKALRDGSVRVAVVVPPGIGYALARSVNEFGLATEQTVDLRIPPFRRLLLVAPEAVPAGSVNEVAVYAVDAAGLPVESSAVVLRVAGGKAQPLGGRKGEARFLVGAPAAAVRGPLRLEAALRSDPQITLSAVVPVAAGPSRRLVLHPDRARLPTGSSLRVYLAAEDLFGNPTDASAAVVLVDGAPVQTRAAEDGRTMVLIRAPPGRDHLEIEAALGSAYTAERVALDNPPPSLHGTGLPRLMITPRLGVVWSLRREPGIAALLELLGRRRRWPDWLVAGCSLGLVATEATAADGRGISRIRLLQLPLLALARYQRRLERGLLLGAGIGLGVQWTEARVTSFGRAVAGQRLGLAAELGGETALPLPTGRLVLGLRYLVVRGGRLSSGDELLGNAGGLVADLGYRLAW